MTLFWSVEIVALIAIGIISDRTEVRKPYMVIGGVGMIIGIGLFIANIGQPASYGYMAFLLSFIAVMISVAYVPWMASYTETVEDVNPALVATGIAVWGSLIRWVVVAQGIAIMYVIGTPEGWANWWFICMAGAAVFIPFVFFMSGHWTTKKARAARLALEYKSNPEPDVEPPISS